MHDLPTAHVEASDDHLSVVYSLRGIAAIWVLAAVIVRTAWPVSTATGFGLFITIAPIGVFALLSGFVLSLGVLGTGRPEMPDLKHFAAKRLLRFIPIVWGAILVTIALDALWLGDVSGTVWDATLPLTASAAVVQMLFLPGFVINGGPNPAVVGIALIVHCSIAFPALVWVWRRIGTAGLAAVGIALAAMSEVLDAPRVTVTLLAIGLFALGMALAGLAVDNSIRSMALRAGPWWVLAVATTVAVLGAFVTMSPADALDHQVLLSIGVAVAAASTVLHVIDNPFGLGARATKFHPVWAVGRMSLSVSLASGPVVQILWKLFCDQSGLSAGAVAVILTLGSPFVFAVAIEMAHWFERPCLGGPDRDAFFAQINLTQPHVPRAVPMPSSAEGVLALMATPAPFVVAPELAPIIALTPLDDEPNAPMHPAMVPFVAAALPPPPAFQSEAVEPDEPEVREPVVIAPVVIDLREPRRLPPPVIDLRQWRSSFAPPLPPPDPRSLVA